MDRPTGRVIRRIEETADVISLILEPADGGSLPVIAPGQYVSVFVDLPDHSRQPHHRWLDDVQCTPGTTDRQPAEERPRHHPPQRRRMDPGITTRHAAGQ